MFPPLHRALERCSDFHNMGLQLVTGMPGRVLSLLRIPTVCPLGDLHHLTLLTSPALPLPVPHLLHSPLTSTQVRIHSFMLLLTSLTSSPPRVTAVHIFSTNMNPTHPLQPNSVPVSLLRNSMSLTETSPSSSLLKHSWPQASNKPHVMLCTGRYCSCVFNGLKVKLSFLRGWREGPFMTYLYILLSAWWGSK